MSKISRSFASFERDESTGRMLLFVVMFFLVAIALAFVEAPANASHGSWTHHDLHIFENGPSQYGSYGDVDAQNQPYNYAHVTWQRLVKGTSTVLQQETVTCGGSCRYRKTLTS